MAERQGPLAHIRVLDLSRIMAAPWATQIMADLGAEVTKVERPSAGDDTRSWGPPFLQGADGTATKEAGYFLAVNRGKRSVTLDIATPEGQEAIRRLAARADIVVENFKAGTLERHGLGYDDLRALNPGIILCSVTGFGQDGPRRDAPAYDFAIQAMGGLMSITGSPEQPQKVGVPIVDLMTGMYAAVAVLAALARRERTGEGERVDLAMLDVSAALLGNQAMNWLVGGRVPGRTGNRHPNIQPQDVFDAADAPFVLAVGNDGQFRALCAALGQPGWGTDERFARNPDRVRNHALLDPLLRAAFAQRPRAALLAALDAAGVPAAPINTVPEVFADPQVQHRRMLRDIPHPLAGSVPSVVSPMTFRNAPLAFDRPPPLLGEHTAEVLREIGL